MNPIVSVLVRATKSCTNAFGVSTPARVARMPKTNARSTPPAAIASSYCSGVRSAYSWP
jgi:hypothetical protein